MDEQFVEYVVKSLVGKPEAVSIKRSVDEKGVLLELTVDAEDLGRVIGKRGATAQSIRTLLRALGTKQEARYNLKIVDVDRLDENGNPLPRPERPERVQNDSSSNYADGNGSSAAPVADDASDDSSGSSFVSAAVPNDDDDQEDKPVEKKESDAMARTRAELADLDDLDI
ncbi:KH domain-containing protein [Candidatus Saccharibacteria bacterium]|nr:MAG: KH domain-containing protein [Candidatus Saccharibacteria bacterium]